MNYTYREMLAQQNSNCDYLAEIEDTVKLLRGAWNRLFEEKEGRIREDELDELGTLLRVCCDRIDDNITSIQMVAGEDVPGAAARVADVEEYRIARTMNKLATEASRKERKLTGADREAFAARRLAAYSLPPAECITALTELLAGGDAH